MIWTPERDEQLVAFIKAKIADAELMLKCREQMMKVWRTGTDNSWREVGCSLTRAERLKESQCHGRIAAKNRQELKMFKALMELMERSAK